MTGSHIDALPLAGAYDGTLGVVGAIAALGALRQAGYKPEKPIEALMFTSEEPTRFGLGCISRRASPDSPGRIWFRVQGNSSLSCQAETLEIFQGQCGEGRAGLGFCVARQWTRKEVQAYHCNKAPDSHKCCQRGTVSGSAVHVPAAGQNFAGPRELQSYALYLVPLCLYIHYKYVYICIRRYTYMRVGRHDPTRSGMACSRAMVGALTAAELDAQPDVNGTSFLEASTAAGYGGSSHQVHAIAETLQYCVALHCHHHVLQRHHGDVEQQKMQGNLLLLPLHRV